MLKKKSIYRDVHHDLIRQCKKGQQKAQMQIYKLYYKAMYNTSLRIVSQAADAEDIMQDSFLDAFQKLNQYSEDGSFGGWLKRIVINNSLDFLHKQKPQTELSDHLEVVDNEEDSNVDIHTHLKIKDVKAALGKIKEEYRIMISLYLFEGYDHEEIGEILNISYSLSRTRYSRAKKKLLEVVKLIEKERSFKWA
ncbi:MAG: sigma-70 family RNA polymerase sigma factor [Bacteroidales bacterium]|nr:sigma-70 family RNA polymerase sigma factor [Bacteroidales bacterium]